MYDYNYEYSVEGDIALIFYTIYWLVYGGFMLVSYVIQSLGYYTIARRRGIKNAWLAWVPVGNAWMLGCISDQYQYVVKGRNKSKRKVLAALELVMCAASAALVVLFVMFLVGMSEFGEHGGPLLPALGMLGVSLMSAAVSIVMVVFRYMALFDLYTSCDPKNNVLFLVLGIVFSVTTPFFVFACRKKDGGMPPRRAAVPEEPAHQPPREPWENEM